jgi:hypothetical protein
MRQQPAQFVEHDRAVTPHRKIKNLNHLGGFWQCIGSLYSLYVLRHAH